ncbi:GNAT family N-acetyltransferase [Wenxinia marina]|uniref:GNAT family N-acetyltransferase n=1 Tax=Wenxinia marina TaxID=390641 RepID=UPI0012F7A01B|nr:GNAT family N-acetyltransferase [Wenxinia marina]
MPTLTTARLVLRPLQRGDADALATALDDWDVIRWLSGPPYPYRLADARQFIADVRAGGAGVWAITLADGGFLGTVGLGVEFGYWLRRGAWGRGYATEATTALLDHHFAGGGAAVEAGIHPDNARSRHLLEKLGFVADGHSVTYFPARRADIERPMFRLTPEAWRRLRDAAE